MNVINFLFSPRLVTRCSEKLFNLFGYRTGNKKLDMALIQKVLVVRLDEIGDVVMTSAFLRELRRNLPNAYITLIVKPQIYTLVELCPYINEVLTYNWDTIGRFRNLKRLISAIGLIYNYLLPQKYDIAIVPRWDVDYYLASFIAYYSGAKMRLAYSEKINEIKARTNVNYDKFFSHVVDDKTPNHEVERNLSLITYCGGKVINDKLEVWISSLDEQFAESVIANHNVDKGKPLIVFVPSARDSKRIWPLENYIEIAQWLKSRYDARIIVLGGQEATFMGIEMHQKLGSYVIDLTGKTTVRQSAALVKFCDVYVGSDTGPMHFASALKVPIVEISCHPVSGDIIHSNSPKRFGPWQVPNIVLQPLKPITGCYDCCNEKQAHCILQITTDQVKDAIRVFCDNSSENCNYSGT